MSQHPLSRRRCGILLHPTSLPDGVLGYAARHFVDFLVAAGQSVWQVLPLGVPHDDGSPYQCLSVHAGNPRLISVRRLYDWGWLPELSDPQEVDDTAAHRDLLEQAYRGFETAATAEQRRQFDEFCQQQDWLNDFALFQALREQYQHDSWLNWPAPVRDRDSQVLSKIMQQSAPAIRQSCFEQYVFYQQWHELKRYANEQGVLLFGDMPIFVAYDSADVWSERRYFDLDDQGQAITVAGVPPDYFSATGQRWGNPHYNWTLMQQDNFHWWLRRLASHLELYDVVRIDHFRGFESYWQIPATEETAMNGRWVKAPGAELFSVMHRHFHALPVVAEDLGIITSEVDALRDQFNLPGMKILQFAFDLNPHNPYLPHNHIQNSVVYTGTHDNDTTLGWYQLLPDHQRQYMCEYLAVQDQDMPWPLIRSAYASVANTAMIPMQDIMALASEHRMNIPGTLEGNWRWRFSWDQLDEASAQRLYRLAALYDRLLDR